MIDQATELRKLVLQSVRQQVAQLGPAPRLVVVASGQSGRGVTTVSLNLAVALAECGSRVVLVDADPQQADIGRLCGFADPLSAKDVQVARRDIHEALQRGPAGLQLIPALWAPGLDAEWPEAAQDRWLRQFRTLGRHAEIVVLDAGGGQHPFLQRCCMAADDVLLVTTGDPAAVMDTYVRIKNQTSAGLRARLHLVVNRCAGSSEAQDVHQRLDQSCRRFLNRQLPLAAWIPCDPAVDSAARAASPLVLHAPEAAATAALQDLAARLLQPAAVSPPKTSSDAA